MRRTHNGKRGFTLVEVIVVLVILAILAAIMIPAMTGWIDKAKEKRLIVACRTCVNAAQTLLAEQYGAAGTRNAPDSADIVALAGVKGTATVDEFSNSNPGQIHKLTYSDGTDSVQYDADACETGEYFIFRAGGAHSFGKATDMDAIRDAFYAKKSGTIDSGALCSDKSDAFGANETLKGLGIDLSALGAKSWSFMRDKNYGNKLMWTNEDIATMGANQDIVIMQYRFDGPAAGMYTVWKAKVVATTNKEYGTYNIINNGYKQLTTAGTTYEEALKVYNNATGGK